MISLNWLYIVQLALQWRHDGHDSISNHQPHDCLLNRLFRRRSTKTSKLSVTGLCAGNSPGTGGFPAQMASYAENVSIWWRHHGMGHHCFRKWLVTEQCQAMTSTSAVLLSIGPMRTKFSEISIHIQKSSFKKIYLKMLSTYCQPFCSNLNALSNVSTKRKCSSGTWKIYLTCRLDFYITVKTNCHFCITVLHESTLNLLELPLDIIFFYNHW